VAGGGGEGGETATVRERAKNRPGFSLRHRVNFIFIIGDCPSFSLSALPPPPLPPRYLLSGVVAGATGGLLLLFSVYARANHSPNEA